MFRAPWPSRASVPVTLHLDHCPERPVITDVPRDRLELRAVRRVGAAGGREHPPDDRGGGRGPPVRRPRGGRDRGRARGRGRDRLRRGGRDLPARGGAWPSSRRPGSTASRRPSALPTASTRPSPMLNPQRVTRPRGPRADPDGAARRHRADRGRLPGPDRPGLREGQHLHGAQGRLPDSDRAFLDANPAKDKDPPSLFREQRAAVRTMAERHLTLFGSAGKAW